MLSDKEIACLTCRVGYLNGLFNPLKPEGHYIIKLAPFNDDRQLLKCFIILSKLEIGINWCEEKFFWSLTDIDWVQGWSLKEQWMQDNEHGDGSDGLHHRGIIKFTFCSSLMCSTIDNVTSAIISPNFLNPPLFHLVHTNNDGFNPLLTVRRALTYVTNIHESTLLVNNNNNNNNNNNLIENHITNDEIIDSISSEDNRTIYKNDTILPENNPKLGYNCLHSELFLNNTPGKLFFITFIYYYFYYFYYFV